ncbi:hypothetical protein ACFWBN_26235 [Streptomyces sp. NPDC059989]|uniref:hypothetical protein n=1 Tax=Streptomyces sp. NPDC059989 TaxID=3347026 RepID=UPI0036C47B57
MNRFFRNLLATTTTVVAISALAAVPAQAQTISGGSCGAGYYQQDAYPLGTDWGGATGAGVLFLYYNKSTGTNCAILRRDSQFSVTDGMAVILEGGGNSDVDGQRAYTQYAGPVYVKAPGSCVRVRGDITGYWTGTPYDEVKHTGNSGWVHCG